MQANIYQMVNPEDKILKKLNRKVNRRVRQNVRSLNWLLAILRKANIYIYDDDDAHWYLDCVRQREGRYYFTTAERKINEKN